MSTWKPLSPTRPHFLSIGIAYGLTDIGQVRESNEDNFLIDETLGLVMLGDGMGGHDGGEIASAEALSSIRDFLRRSPRAVAHAGPDDTIPELDTLAEALAFANQHLYAQNTAAGIEEGRGMGTTITGIWQPLPNGPLLAFHVGDSRLYRLRDGELTQLTRDQTLYQLALDAGTLDALPPRNLLLQAVGPGATLKPEVKPLALLPGDLFLLCSDGLHGEVPDTAIAEVLARTDAADLGRGAAELVALANRMDGRDNITVVLVLAS